MSPTSKPKSVKPSTKTSTKATKSSSSDSEADIKGTADGASYRVVHRSLLKNAKYNPRFIDPVAQKRLKESLERSKGLIQAPVWNEKSGNIVGGHKRVQQMDAIKGSADYTLTVAVVNYDLPEEIEANIRLNNPSLTGQYNLNLLDDLLAREDVQIEHTGFDISTLELMHMDAGVDLPDFMLTPEEIASKEEIEDLTEEIEELSEEAEAQDAEEINEGDIDEIKSRKKEFAERQQFLHHNNIAVRVIFPTAGVRALFAEIFEVDADSEFVDGVKLLEMMGAADRVKEVVESEKPTAMKKSEDTKEEKSSKRAPKKSRK